MPQKSLAQKLLIKEGHKILQLAVADGTNEQ